MISTHLAFEIILPLSTEDDNLLHEKKYERGIRTAVFSNCLPNFGTQQATTSARINGKVLYKLFQVITLKIM